MLIKSYITPTMLSPAWCLRVRDSLRPSLICEGCSIASGKHRGLPSHTLSRFASTTPGLLLRVEPLCLGFRETVVHDEGSRSNEYARNRTSAHPHAEGWCRSVNSDKHMTTPMTLKVHLAFSLNPLTAVLCDPDQSRCWKGDVNGL